MISKSEMISRRWSIKRADLVIYGVYTNNTIDVQKIVRR